MIWNDMNQVGSHGVYKPWISCQTIKECDKDQSPLEVTELKNVQIDFDKEASVSSNFIFGLTTISTTTDLDG